MNRQRGFTLIEIMITVAIIAILAAVGYPSYADYVRRGKITEAIAGLSNVRVIFEQSFQDNRAYTNACTGGKPANVADTSNFTFSCVTGTSPDSYTVTARGAGSMNGFVYTVDQQNTRRTTGVPTGWSGAGSSCWVLKKDGSC